MSDTFTPEPEYAFPWVNPNNGNGGSGVTLRDYFAGQALAGMLAFSALPDATGRCTAVDFAKAAYRQADAMIAERERT